MFVGYAFFVCGLGEYMSKNGFDIWICGQRVAAEVHHASSVRSGPCMSSCMLRFGWLSPFRLVGVCGISELCMSLHG